MKAILLRHLNNVTSLISSQFSPAAKNFLVLSSERWVNEERRWKTSAPPV